MGKLIHANKEEFEQIIQTETGIVVVDFYAEWCGPCKVLGPTLQDISEDSDDVTVVKINVDEGDNSMLSASFGVRSIPAVFIFKGGEQVGKFVGNKPRQAIEQIIETHRLSTSTDEAKN